MAENTVTIAEASRMPITLFVAELKKACERHDGYIMGATGQNPRTWTKGSWFLTQYKNRSKYTEANEKKALYWYEHAARVWDCNGLAEGIYKDYTGVSIDTKARYNYANWCGVKGSGMIPAEYRVPGAAIFWGNRASDIHHVAYLVEPVSEGKPEGDWYIIEARGVMYGVVKTRLNERKPNYWGLMDLYYDYSGSDASCERILRRGMSGADVKSMQEALIRLGYSCGKYGADGDFGSETEAALIKMQENNRLLADGIYGAESRAMVEKLLALLDNTPELEPDAKPEPPEDGYSVTGGSVWLWTAPPGNGGQKAHTVHKGDALAKPDAGYVPIAKDGAIYWINAKYVQEVQNH